MKAFGGQYGRDGYEFYRQQLFQRIGFGESILYTCALMMGAGD